MDDVTFFARQRLLGTRQRKLVQLKLFNAIETSIERFSIYINICSCFSSLPLGKTFGSQFDVFDTLSLPPCSLFETQEFLASRFTKPTSLLNISISVTRLFEWLLEFASIFR